MRVSVKLFAVARQLAGADSVDVELADGGTIAQLRAALAKEHPALEPIVRGVAFAVGTDYAKDSTVLQAGADVACIPPVSGG